MECENCNRKFEQEGEENLCPDCLREWQDCILVSEYDSPITQTYRPK